MAWRDIPPNLLIVVLLHTILGAVESPTAAALNYFQPFIVDFANQSVYEHYGIALGETGYSWLWSVLVTLLAVGRVAAALPLAWLLETLGRRAVSVNLFSATLLLALGLQLFARNFHSVEMFALGRLLVGVADQLHSPVVIFMSECAPVRYRGSSSVILSSGPIFFLLLGVILALPSIFANEARWNLYFLVWIPPAIAYFLSSFYIQPSPKHLYIRKGDEEAARKAIRFYQGDQADTDAVIANYDREVSLSQSRRLMPLRRLWRVTHLRKPFVLCLVVGVAAQLSGVGVLSEYMMPILASVGVGQTGSVVLTIVLVVIAVPFALLVQLRWVETMGRRPLLLAALVATALAHCAVAAAEIAYHRNDDQSWWLSISLALIFVLCASLGNGLGLAFLPGLLVGECCPQSIRSRVFQLSAILSSVIGIGLSLGYPPLHASFGAATYLFFIVPAVVSVIWLWLHLPETANRPVNQIVEQWREDAPSESSELLDDGYI